jgi:hypothetical protein
MSGVSRRFKSLRVKHSSKQRDNERSTNNVMPESLTTSSPTAHSSPTSRSLTSSQRRHLPYMMAWFLNCLPQMRVQETTAWDTDEVSEPKDRVLFAITENSG